MILSTIKQKVADIPTKQLLDELEQFQLFVEEGRINKEVPLARYFEAEEWGEANPDKVEVFYLCCTDLGIRPEKLTEPDLIAWHQSLAEN